MSRVTKKRIDVNDVPEDVRKYLDILVLEIFKTKKKYHDIDRKTYFIDDSRKKYKDANSWKVYGLMVTYSGFIPETDIYDAGAFYMAVAKSSSRFSNKVRLNLLGKQR